MNNKLLQKQVLLSTNMSEKRKADDDLASASKKDKRGDDVGNGEEKGDSPAHSSEDSNDGAGASADNSVALPCRVKGPEHCGTLLICGSTNWDMAGKRDVQKGGNKNVGRNLWSPHLFKPLEGIRVRVIASGNSAGHSVIVAEDGRCLTFGRNPKGQLGVGDCNRRDSPTLVESLKEETIVGAACGRHHTLFLTDRGEVYSAGDNKLGQCGIGNQNPIVSTATKIKYKGAPIVKVDCGGEFSLVLDCRGVLFSFGCPEYGQLGHNSDGKYFVTCNKLGFACETKPKRIMFYVEKGRDGHTQPVDDVEIRELACGTNHTVVVDSKRRAFSWGFGGYGRLGHADTKDEMLPRLIKFFDAQGRGVKSGLGEMRKSSTTPIEVKALEGVHIMHVVCGVSHTLMLARDDTEEEKARIRDFPMYSVQ
ncbi:hypothetical protein B566_EDAN013376 [Ephemera danica]|nr:hypothetical protein B566_EDAN013376 [Ephemera danica]